MQTKRNNKMGFHEINGKRTRLKTRILERIPSTLLSYICYKLRTCKKKDAVL